MHHQIFLEINELSDYNFNVKLYCARKIAEHTISVSKLSQSSYFYLPSFSTHTLIYKGLLTPEDIKGYYNDLEDPAVVTRLALVHQRFSTNTFPPGISPSHFVTCAIMEK